MFIIFLIGCGNKSIHLEEDLVPRYNKAMKYFNKGKYSRAKDEFDYIIMIDPGSKIANESHYYMGEALFQISEYSEAAIIFDRYVRFSSNISK